MSLFLHHINYKTKICSTVMNSLSHNLICLLKAYNKKPDSYETSGLIILLEDIYSTRPNPLLLLEHENFYCLAIATILAALNFP